MTKKQFEFMCNNFGNTDLPENERWKAIRYIYVESPLMDVQFLIKKGMFAYIDNEDIGPGFYILGEPNADIEPINNERVITFIPLENIDKISFVGTYA